jgi:hypothetical protein
MVPVATSRAAYRIPATPVGDACRWWLQGHGHHLGGLTGLEAAGTTAAGLIRQTGQAGFDKATPDTADLDLGVAGPTGDLGTRDVIGDQQDGSCTATESGRDRRGPLQSLQFPPVTRGQNDGTRMVGHDPSHKGSLQRTIPR